MINNTLAAFTENEQEKAHIFFGNTSCYDDGKKIRGGPGVVIQARLYGYLHNEAKRRNVSAHDLVRMIVANVVDDDLFSAVLDK